MRALPSDKTGPTGVAAYSRRLWSSQQMQIYRRWSRVPAAGQLQYRSPSVQQLATVIKRLRLLLQWIREAILLRHSCVRATLPLLLAGVPGDRARPAYSHRPLAARSLLPGRAAPINLDRRQPRKRRCGDVTPAIRIRASQPVASLLFRAACCNR